jgi:hypothetical protein
MYNHWHHCYPRYDLGYGGYGGYNPYLLRPPYGIGGIYNGLSTEGYLGYPSYGLGLGVGFGLGLGYRGLY